MATADGARGADRACSGSRPTALVLAGGGARGAYEAGVVQYVLDELPRSAGVAARFDLFAGTSVGALNASFLGATSDRPGWAARRLAEYWHDLSMERVVRFGARETVALSQLLLGRRWGQRDLLTSEPRPPSGTHPPVAGVFDTTPLRREMRESIPWEQLQRNLLDGTTRGVALCATEVCSGKAVVFHQTCGDAGYVPPGDPTVEAVPVALSVEHAMASAAIPFVFPSVQVKGVCYVDGALHQNAPLMPAIRMGAGRVLVISLCQDPAVRFRRGRRSCRRNPYPGAIFLLGRVLGAFLDHALDRDMARIQRVNRLTDELRAVPEPQQHAVMERVAGAFRNTGYRRIEALHIRPSRDLNELAMEAIREAPGELRLPGATGRAVERILLSPAFIEAELTSYVLFTATYARKLLALGRADAEARRDELVAFFAEGGEG